MITCSNIFLRSTVLAVFLLVFPRATTADSATTVLTTGSCLRGCGNLQTAVTVASLTLISNSTSKSITPSFNLEGQLIFNATVSGPGISTVNNQVLLRRERDGALTEMATNGTPIRNSPGTTLNSGIMPQYSETAKIFGNDGSVIFTGGSVGEGINASNNYGVFCLTGVDAVPLLRHGVNPPSETTPLAAGASLNLQKKFEPYLHPNFPGCTGAFRGSVSVPSPSGNVLKDGIWIAGVGQLGERVGRTWAPARLLPDGLLFGSGIAAISGVATNLSRIEYSGNSMGDALIHAFLEGPGVRRDPNVDALPLNNEALWYRSAEGEIRLVARTGEPVPGQPDRLYSRLVQRTANDPASPPNNPDQNVRFGSEGLVVNEHSQIAFHALTTDITGTDSGAAVITNRSGNLEIAFQNDDIVTSAAFNKRWKINTIAAGNLRFASNGTIYATGFVTELNLAGVPTGSPIVMLLENSVATGTRPVLWQYQPIPGVPGRVFDTSFADASHEAENFFDTDHGTLLVTTRTDDSGYGIFRYNNGELSLLARHNQVPPGLNGGYLTFYGGLRPNSKGQFIVYLAGGSIIVGDDTGNFRYAVDANRNIPNASELALQNNIQPCVPGLLSDRGDFPLICGGRLVHYTLTAPFLQCPADFNRDGNATIQDIFDFLSQWFALDLRADSNHDQIITLEDLFAFLTGWFAGC